jgi:hypothetical protein
VLCHEAFDAGTDWPQRAAHEKITGLGILHIGSAAPLDLRAVLLQHIEQRY